MNYILPQEMADQIQAWSSSGLSKLAYCRKFGLSYHKLNYHIKHSQGNSKGKKISKIKPDSGFELLKPAPNISKRIELHLPNGCFFSLPEDCSLSILQKLANVC